MTLSLSGRAAIITGANQGLGLAIAREYVSAGASVCICARGVELLDRVRQELAAVARPDQRVVASVADVSNQTDVQRLVREALEEFPRLHILVNNAGIYGPKGPLEEVDWEAWTQAININLLGSVLLTRALLPHFKANGYGKIIQLSGGGATGPLPLISAYAASKAAIVRLAETVSEEVRDYHVDVNAIAPGALNTRLLDEVLEAGPQRVGKRFYERALTQKREGGTPLDRGAKLAVFLGARESDGITGKLISAIWDPWEHLPEHLADLASSDVYTLRRIVPRDRGLDWGNA